MLAKGHPTFKFMNASERIQDFQIPLRGGAIIDYDHAAHIPSAKREVPHDRDPGPSRSSLGF